MTDASLPGTDSRRRIDRECADLLYASPLPMAVAFALAIALTLVLWDDVPPWAALGWLSLVSSVIGIRLWLRRAYFASGGEPARLWLDRYAHGALALGLFWSLSGLVIWIDDDALCQAVVVVVACGMASGAVASNAPHTPAVDRFIWPLFLVLVAGLASWGDRLHLALAAIGILYVVSLGVISRAARRTIAGTIQVKLEKEALIEQLGAALIEVEAAGRAKTSFLANMSHELRTPLNAILGFSEMLVEQRHGALGAPNYRDYARDIHQSGKHLLDLVNDILDLTKIEAGHLELREELVDVGELVPICCRMLRQRAEEGDVRLESEVAPDLTLLRGDRGKLRQILLNLISNAIKFTPAGGRITVSAFREKADGGITLSVADTGVGMSAKDIPVALQPFRQIESSLARAHQGTGLGLPLAKALAELHGGTLTVASEPNEGTVVTVAFPPERGVTLAAMGGSSRSAAS